MEMGGEHDHGVDSMATHLHRGADDRILVHAGGYHDHYSSDGEVDYSAHFHRVLGDTGRDGLPMDLNVAKAQVAGRVIISKDGHTVLDDADEASVIQLAKTLSKEPFSDSMAWAIRYQWDEWWGSVVLKASSRENLAERYAEALETADAVAKWIGNAELVEITGRAGNHYVGVRKEAFAYSDPIEKGKLKSKKRGELSDSSFGVVRGSGKDKVRKFPIHDESHAKNALARMGQSDLTASEKKSLVNKIRKRYPSIKIGDKVLQSVGLKKQSDCAELEDEGKDKDKDKEQDKAENVSKGDHLILHSIIFDKSVISADLAREWAQKNYLSADRCLDLGDEIAMIQKDSESTEFVEQSIAKGILARFIKGEADEFTHAVEFKKFDEAKRIVYGEVYVPWLVDSQGDFATPEDIEKVCHDFLLDGNLDCIDTQHDFQKNGCRVVESYIAKVGDPNFTHGSWVLGTKVSGDDVWNQILKGDINGYSMAGSGMRIPLDETTEADLPLIFKSLDGEPSGFLAAFKKATEDEKRQRKKHRLTKMKVGFVSMVKRGAIGRDFGIIKSADAAEFLVPIFKSAEHRLLEGDFEQVQAEGWFTGLIQKGLRSFFGGSPHSGTDTTPVERKDALMSTAQQPGGLAVLVMDLLKNTLGRQAAFEKSVLELFSKSPEMNKILKEHPEIQAHFSQFNPEDLVAVVKEIEKGMGGEDFAKMPMPSVGTGFLQSPEDTPVSLPAPRNFFGALVTTMSVGSLLSAERGSMGNAGPGMNVGFLGNGSPSAGGGATMRKELDAQINALTKQIDELRGNGNPPAEFALIKSEMEALKAKFDTFVKDSGGQSTTPPAANSLANGDDPPVNPPTEPAATGEIIKSVFTTDELFSGGFGRPEDKN